MTQYYHGHYHALRNRFNRMVQVVVTNARGEDRTLMAFMSQGILSPSFGEVSPEQTATKGPRHPAYVHGSALASQSALPRTLPRANGLQVPEIVRHTRPHIVGLGSAHHTFGSKTPPNRCRYSSDPSHSTKARTKMASTSYGGDR